MTISSFEHSPQRFARFSGVLYLAIIVLGSFGEMFVRATLVISGDPAATANAIAGSPLLWRAGIVGDLLMQVLDVPVIVIFYLLLKPVSKSLALFATLINLVQTAVLAANKLNLVLPLFLLKDTHYLNAFSPEQLNVLAYLAIQAHSYGFAIGLIFFGVACLVRAYLIYKSSYFPKILGVLMFGAGLSYLTNSVALLLVPSFAALIFPAILAPALVAELSLSLWLIAKGINVAKWKQRVALAPAQSVSEERKRYE